MSHGSQDMICYICSLSLIADYFTIDCCFYYHFIVTQLQWVLLFFIGILRTVGVKVAVWSDYTFTVFRLLNWDQLLTLDFIAMDFSKLLS